MFYLMLYCISFGIVLWELVTGLVPYEEQNFETVAGAASLIINCLNS